LSADTDPAEISYICSAHRLRVQPGSGAAPLEHEGGNAGRPCGSQVFTVTERRKATRAEVLAALEMTREEEGP